MIKMTNLYSLTHSKANTKHRLNLYSRLGLGFMLTSVSIILLYLTLVSAVPEGVNTITYISNSTKSLTAGNLINSTFNSSVGPGGYIFTMNLDTTQQNKRWKAYVGNVTGKLTLDDASSYTIFD